MGEAIDPVLLGGYAAKRCPVRVHNDFSPAVPTRTWVPTPEDVTRLDAGRAFESDVIARLRALHPDSVLIDSAMGRSEAMRATADAMDANVGVIIGGWLADDVTGGRTGRPDLLLRVKDGGYVPGDIKNHHTIVVAKIAAATVSSLAKPTTRSRMEGWTSATSHRFEDGMQLAHYTRMLQAYVRHPGDEWLVGAIVGTDELALTPDAPARWMLTWHNLAEPFISTYSRSRGKAKRSLLERYDHEHGFRVRVAQRARQIIGDPTDPPPLVTPIGQAECESCPYHDPCAAAMQNDPSAQITIGRLDTREWLALRSMGITTTLELAELDINDSEFARRYMAAVTQQSAQNALERLSAAIERAAMIRDGIHLLHKHEHAVEVPTATVEIDVDIETDQNGRVYMWGARLRTGTDDATAHYYTDFTVWESLDDGSERALAERFAHWLRGQRVLAEDDGGTLSVFHWSHPEWSNLKRILGAHEVRDLIGDRDGGGDDSGGVFIDLEKVFKEQFTALRGTSIKKVAPLFDFRWRVADPGGAISQTYLSKVHSSADVDEVEAAKAWLQSYNEDDAAAMAKIRDGMRKWTG